MLIVYNIVFDVIHNCQEICITSKTMLYTIARKFDKKTCYTGENVLKMGCIKCFSMLYTFCDHCVEHVARKYDAKHVIQGENVLKMGCIKCFSI